MIFLRAKSLAYVLECLASKHKALSANCSTTKKNFFLRRNFFYGNNYVVEHKIALRHRCETVTCVEHIGSKIGKHLKFSSQQ
jgi:hypothetical protein